MNRLTDMKTMNYEVPDEIRTNRVDDLFRPCWIVKAIRTDRVDSENEQGWIALVVFEDTNEMLEMIGDWGQSPVQRSDMYSVDENIAPIGGAG